MTQKLYTHISAKECYMKSWNKRISDGKDKVKKNPINCQEGIQENEVINWINVDSAIKSIRMNNK
jgi:hypothetical protein